MRVAQQRAATPARQHHWVYQMVAVCLLLLAASPVTAPFSTYDLRPGASHPCTSDVTKVKFDPDHAPLISPCLGPTVLVAAWALVVRASTLPLRRGDSAPTPLRI
jgi:hypothetical protein